MDGSSLSHSPVAAAFNDEADWRREGDAGREGEVEIRFRGFCLRPGARMLLRDGTPVEIGSRAFDLLHVLARARGSVVAKRDIVRHVWPSTVVEESNLRFQVGVLRKALGRDRDLIKTVAGRGYIFAAERLADAEPRPLLQLIQTEPDARRSPHDLLVSRLAASPEAREALHLLRAVLDELWQITPDSEDRMAAASH